MKNLYDVLGISRNATLEEIKSAYHRKSKECHPDITGTDELQKEVNLAYEVLSNPEKRSDYDQTGRWDSNDIPEHEMITELIQAFIQLILANVSEIDTNLDFVVQLKTNIQNVKKSAETTIKHLEKEIKALEKSKKKIKKKSSGRNIFLHAVEHVVAEKTQQITLQKNRIERFEQMLEIVNDYEWDKVLQIALKLGDIVQ